ncbi:MAG: pitrilysin family protein [Pseudomonadota bacterium]
MNYRITRLNNGLTIVTDSMPHLKSAALGVWVNAGSRAESDTEHGLAHLLEHMAFKGTATRSAGDIAEEIEAVGGELNAATSAESTAYYARVLSDEVPLAVDLLGDILQNATFDPEELVKEQHVILQEIGASLDVPEDLVFDRFQEMAFPNQPLGRPILGTPESVTGFGRGEIETYLKKHYCASQMVVSAAGDVDHEAFCRLVKDRFTGLTEGAGGQQATATYHGGEWIDDRPLQEAQILIGFEGVPYLDDTFFTVQLLAAVLGGGMSSRLFQEVREKRGLCYSIYSFHWAYSDTGLFGIQAATGEEDVAELMPVILEELRSIGQTLGESEVKRAKAQMRAGLMMSLESPASRATQLARQLLLFGRCLSPEEQLERVNEISVEDVKQAAASIFSHPQPTLAAIGPVNGLMSASDIAAALSLSQAAE